MKKEEKKNEEKERGWICTLMAKRWREKITKKKRENIKNNNNNVHKEMRIKAAISSRDLLGNAMGGRTKYILNVLRECTNFIPSLISRLCFIVLLSLYNLRLEHNEKMEGMSAHETTFHSLILSLYTFTSSLCSLIEHTILHVRRDNRLLVSWSCEALRIVRGITVGRKTKRALTMFFHLLLLSESVHCAKICRALWTVWIRSGGTRLEN